MILFTDILRQIRRGAPVEEATQALADVVRAVDETGKPGKITLELVIKPAKHGGPEKVIACAVKATKPRASIAEAIFFSTDDGDLLRTDPRQEEMVFEDARKATK